MKLYKKVMLSAVCCTCGIAIWQAMRYTNPPKEEHQQVIAEVVDKAINRIVNENLPKDSKELSEYIKLTVLPDIVIRMTEQKMNFSDYGILGIGQMENGKGETVPLSFGLFGKVFTISEQNAYEYLNRLLENNDINQLLINLKYNENGNQDYQTNEGE